MLVEAEFSNHSKGMNLAGEFDISHFLDGKRAK
jgi:hypothetical protein